MSKPMSPSVKGPMELVRITHRQAFDTGYTIASCYPGHASRYFVYVGIGANVVCGGLN